MATADNPLSDLDFEEVYSGKATVDGQPPGIPSTPWDIGEPQPVLVEVAAAGQVRGAVLDVGCGLGDNAIHLAERGLAVTAVDIAPSAIEQARRRAAGRGVDVEFAVADATRLDGYDGRFDTVVDSALFHCFDAAQRAEYLAALHRACVPGGTVHMFCCADEASMRIPVPNPVSEAELRHGFTGGWRLDDLRESRYTAVFGPEAFAGLLASQGAPIDDLSRLDLDEAGRVRFPIWKVVATRL